MTNSSEKGQYTADPLSEILEGLHVSNHGVDRFDLTAPWGIRVPGDGGWFHAVVHGECLLHTASLQSAIRLETGDLVVLPLECGHTLRDSPASPIVNMEELAPTSWSESLKDRTDKAIASDASLICGSFRVDVPRNHPLYEALPPLIHVKCTREESLPSLDYILDLIACESVSSQPGAQTVINRLVRILFVKAIQSHVTRMPESLRNVLKALLDADIGPAVALMHKQPEKPWTVAALAETVSMSRSVFSFRFAREMHMPPWQYLLGCRMHKACTLLQDARLGLSEVASQTGYESASAFGKAFKRWAGVSPGDYRSQDTSDVQQVGESKRPGQS